MIEKAGFKPAFFIIIFILYSYNEIYYKFYIIKSSYSVFRYNIIYKILFYIVESNILIYIKLAGLKILKKYPLYCK